MYIYCLYGIIYFFCLQEYIAVYILSWNKMRLYYVFIQICVSFHSEFKSAKMLLSIGFYGLLSVGFCRLLWGVEQELWNMVYLIESLGLLYQILLELLCLFALNI